MKNYIDLHTHSTASDGQYTPSELIVMAKQLDLKAIAITDHDTIDGLAEAQSVAKKLDVRFIPGIEINTKFPGVGGHFHILGYGFDLNNENLKAFCADLLVKRQEKAERVFSFLAKHGVCPSKGRVYALANQNNVGRPHFARAMVEEGFVSSTKEAFDKYLDTDDFNQIKNEKPHPKQAIAQIMAAGGIAVLAHPSQLKLNNYSLKGLIQELKSYGLEGLECYYSTNNQEQTHDYISLAQELDLYVTGGSDFHGEKVKADIKLGTGVANSLRVPATLEILAKLK